MSQESHNDRSGQGSHMVPRILGVMILLIYLAFIGASFVWAGIWDIIKGHYVFFVRVPFSAIIAYVLAYVLEHTRGRIEFEVLPLKFKGASVPIVFWVLVFLAQIVAIRMTWALS